MYGYAWGLCSHLFSSFGCRSKSISSFSIGRRIRPREMAVQMVKSCRIGRSHPWKVIMGKEGLWRQQGKSGGTWRMPRTKGRGRHGKSGGNGYDVRPTGYPLAHFSRPFELLHKTQHHSRHMTPAVCINHFRAWGQRGFNRLK